MLKVINLFIITKIFDGAESSVSSISKMIYINCLIHYFKNKPCNRENSKGFVIFDCEFNFNKFKSNFQELHMAGLITIENSGLTFHNLWGKDIDWSNINQETNEEHLTQPLSNEYFRVSGKLYYGPVSVFLQKNFNQFLEVWLMGHNSDVVHENKTFSTMDLCYNCTDFENLNHVKNAFIKTWKDVQKERDRSTNTARQSSTFNSNKAQIAELGKKTREYIENRKLQFGD